jgi:hypothetical protein
MVIPPMTSRRYIPENASTVALIFGLCEKYVA